MIYTNPISFSIYFSGENSDAKPSIYPQKKRQTASIKPSIRILKEFSRNHSLIPIYSSMVDNHRLFLTKEHDDICPDLSDATYQLIDAESIHEIP
jgi:hypothetical protein